jgi:hypothetical protein
VKLLYSVKQGGGATVLREERDIVTGENCDHYSLNINILGKAAMLWLGPCQLSLQIIRHSGAHSLL